MKNYLFIGGAHKCGTSSLFNYLSTHSQINASSPKETFYFMDEEHPLLNFSHNFINNGVHGFQEFFKPSFSSDEILLEATTHYLYQKSIAEKLKSLNGSKKIIFILREPANRVYSSFQYTQNNLALLPKNIKFSKYVEDIISNNTTDYLKSNKLYVLKNDVEYSKYIKYLSYWYKRFEAEDIKLLLFEDLVKKPLMLLRQISEFLEIDSKEFDRIDMQAKNVTVEIKNYSMHRVILKLNKSFGSIVPTLWKNWYKSIQSKQKVDINPDDAKALKTLKEYYKPYNSQLVDRFGLDITMWD